MVQHLARSTPDQTRFVLNEKQWKAFMVVLNRPAKDKPRLRRLFQESHVAKRRP
jgi:uncharacterized protein (DUF1778 family)